MATTIDLSLAAGVTLSAPSGEDAHLTGPRGRLTIRRPSADLHAALGALAAGAVAESTLASLARGDAALLFYHLDSAADLGLLCWTLVCDGQRLVSSSPVSPHFVRLRAQVDEDTPRQLSRFTYSRAVEAGVLLECPLSQGVVTVHDRRVAALLFELGRPCSPRAAAERVEGLDVEAARAVVELLAEAGMLAPAGAGSRDPSEIALRQWEFHDLLFHARSRGHRHGERTGATYRWADEIPPLPAVKPPMSGDAIDLFRPDIDALRREDAPFTDVLERRRSIRARGPAPLTARQLGELLFRTARVRGARPSPRCELTDRPYPAAGALYELEIYPVINTCNGIPAGFYHYCPMTHRLLRLSGETDDARALLESAREAEAPDALLIIAARYQRVAWKYESIAYALILKDAGVLLQTMYLVATAMSLSPYAVGHGDPDRFCSAARTDYYVESSVAELALSGAPPGDPR